MWLATLIAPDRAAVHDHVGPIDEELLSAIYWSQIRKGRHGVVLLDVSDWVDELTAAGLVDAYTRLTTAGEKYLATLWGPGRVPPWSGGYYSCWEHGDYDAGPGDPSDCPKCPALPPPKSALVRALEKTTHHPL